MDQHLDTLIILDAVGMSGGHRHRDRARDRRVHGAVGGNDTYALAHGPAGEHRIRHLLQRDHAAVHRRGDQHLDARRRSGRGRCRGGRCLGRRGFGGRDRDGGVIHAPEEGEQERHHDSDATANEEQRHVVGHEEGRDRDQRREHEGVAGRTRHAGEQATHDATDDAEVERVLAGQVDAVDGGLGDAREEARQRRGAGELLCGLVLGAQHDRQRGCGLSEHGGENRTENRLDAVVVELLQNDRHEAPVQAEHHEDLPEAAHDGARQPRSKGEHPHDGVGEGGGHEAGRRADGEQDQRHHDQHGEQRHREVANGRGQHPGEETLKVAQHPDPDDDRNHGAGVAHDHQRDAEEGERSFGLTQIDDARVDQRAGDGHRGELIDLEAVGCGDGQEQRQEVDQRIGGCVQHRVGGGGRIDPAELGEHGQERLEQARTGKRPQNGVEDGADHLDESIEDATLRRLFLFFDRCTTEMAHDPGVHLGHLVADDHLVLAAGQNDGHDPLKCFDAVGVGLRLITQFQPQPRRAMLRTLNVSGATDFVHDSVGKLVKIDRHARSSSTWSSPGTQKAWGKSRAQARVLGG